MAQFETDSPEVSESYICIHCSHPVSSLCASPRSTPPLSSHTALTRPNPNLTADITYPNPSNTSLLQCPAQCGNLADVYTTLTFPVLLVDLLLFKPRVYRHLLCNRGPRDSEQRARGRTESLWRVGGVVIGLDACKSSRALACFRRMGAEVPIQTFVVRTSGPRRVYTRFGCLQGRWDTACSVSVARQHVSTPDAHWLVRIRNGIATRLYCTVGAADTVILRSPKRLPTPVRTRPA
jgi:hypothetical protein